MYRSDPKLGGSEAEQATYDCDYGQNSASWVLPGDPEDNDTTYVTPN
jgi:hypothetical protein